MCVSLPTQTRAGVSSAHAPNRLFLRLWAVVIALAGPAFGLGNAGSPGVPRDPGIGTTVSAGLQGLQAGKFTLQDLLPVDDGGEVVINVLLAGQPYQLALREHSLRAPGFRVLVQESDGACRDLPVPECRTCRGRVRGCAGSSVCAAVSKGAIRAFVCLGDAKDSTWVIEPLPVLPPEAGPAAHLVYRSEDLAGEPGVCGNRDIPVAKASSGATRNNASANADMLLCRIACDADYEYYALNGSSVTNTIADIETVIDGVSAIYERDIGVSFQLTQIIVRTAEPDPYDSTTVDGLLSQFRLDWQNNHPDIARDVAHLFTGKSFGTVLGNSYTDQVCPGRNHYSLVRSRWQTDPAKRIALSAHEIGHSFGAAHCDYDSDPRCRIMCSNLGGCSNGYHSFEDMNVARIRAAAASAACLTTGTVPAPVTSLPFADDFNSITYPPQAPDANRWTAADLAQCQYQHLEISIGRDYNYNQKLGMVRTLPMALSGPARVHYKVNPNLIPSSQSFKVEFFNTASFAWQILRTIAGNGTGTYVAYDDTVPASAAGNQFALRFSAWATAYTASYSWSVEDVSITPIAVAPQLSVARTESNTVVIAWPQTAPSWNLEASPLLADTDGWTLIPPPYPTNATQFLATEPIASGSRFYRLRSP